MASIAQERKQPRRRQPRKPIADVISNPARNYPALIVGAMMASLLQVLDGTIANVALPHMQAALGATADTVTWVLTSYIIAAAVAMPITGWLADLVGANRLFMLAVVGFVGASMLCGTAQNLEQMVIFRAIQGVSGAFVAPLSQSFMLDSTRPSRQPTMMAVWSAGIMIGPILGPIIGGWLTENGSWRWVFYVNVPVGALAFTMLALGLPSRPRRKRRFDIPGFAMLGIGLAAMQLLLDRGTQIDWFQSAEAWVYAIVIASAIWMAIIHFATTDNALLDPHIFADRNFLVAFVMMLLVGGILFATIALLPPLMQHLLGYDVITTGLVLSPRGIGVLVSMQLGGYLLRRQVDARIVIATGFVIADLAMWQMAHWSLEVDMQHFIWTGVLQGLGIGLVFMPLNYTAFATLDPAKRTDASSMLNLARNVGSSVGISIVTVFLARNIQISHADLASHVTSATTDLIDVATVDRFQILGNGILQVIDGEVNRQAAMVGYVDDFYLMFWMTLVTMPLVFLMDRIVPPKPGEMPTPSE
ncbi:DHA2 family efflux MFS transporter permease subunit [Tsuneonella mangrovi]|uniref:DHA2 family efflux MFS transporter permease subunit n=1 Tax=Tsuneonella mangrovi TaxID=1982042 RepID=UPI000BA1D5BC|nr:DHA2 family efflux MFS transporter permease subunit [Tsuneonella mangrovi]